MINKKVTSIFLYSVFSLISLVSVWLGNNTITIKYVVSLFTILGITIIVSISISILKFFLNVYDLYELSTWTTVKNYYVIYFIVHALLILGMNQFIDKTAILNIIMLVNPALIGFLSIIIILLKKVNDSKSIWWFVFTFYSVNLLFTMIGILI